MEVARIVKRRTGRITGKQAAEKLLADYKRKGCKVALRQTRHYYILETTT